MKNIFRVVMALAAVALGVWLWGIIFPSAETVIRRRLENLGETASVKPHEGFLRRAADAQKLGGFFATNVEVNIDLPGHNQRMLMSRDDLAQAAMAARWSGGFTVQFPDINVTVHGDTAVADVTVQARVAGEPDLIVQELRISLQKVDGQWQIRRVETVRTLSLRRMEKSV